MHAGLLLIFGEQELLCKVGDTGILKKNSEVIVVFLLRKRAFTYCLKGFCVHLLEYLF